MKPPPFEIRRVPVFGTLYVEHAIYVNGQRVYGQLSPFSEDEIEQRINQYIRPMATPPVKPDNWGVTGKPGRKTNAERAAKYDWRTARDEPEL